MMRILVISPYNVFLPKGGAAMRIFYLVKGLTNNANVKVTLLQPSLTIKENYFKHPDLNNPTVVEYPSISWFEKLFKKGLLTNILNTYLAMLNKQVYRYLYALLKNENYPIVQVETPHLFLPAYLIVLLTKLRFRKKSKPILILDAHNCETITALSRLTCRSRNFISLIVSLLITLITSLYFFFIESIAAFKATAILCVSNEDKDWFTKLYRANSRRLYVIPNGVDFSKMGTKGCESKNPLINNSNRKVIFFHGNLSWFPNSDAAEIISKYIAPRVKNAIFLIAGVGASPDLLKTMSAARNVKYLGYVEEIASWIKLADVCIAPILSGGGTRLKILEYAATGKPIVATFKAVEGLNMKNGVHGLFYNDVNEDFIRGIKILLEDKQLARKLGDHAKSLAKKFDWHVIGEKLYKIYVKILEREPPQ